MSRDDSWQNMTMMKILMNEPIPRLHMFILNTPIVWSQCCGLTPYKKPWFFWVFSYERRMDILVSDGIHFGVPPGENLINEGHGMNT